MNRLIWWCCGLALVILAQACAGAQVPRDQLTAPGALLFNGYAKDTVDCYKCHGGEGKGSARGPSLEKRVPKYPADKLFSIIRDGSGKMPKYGPSKITDDEIKQVVSWLQATFTGPAPAAQ